ncbi:endo-1,3(4)-beta-glucanase 1-like [Argentina anserina]|uniref:endo-1,3(4)-beta-glucanase 1-like n=1 Tax=Argentina anserina TaxID=57926 RepID=UPI002176934A|nr:endo-1,3(4)-beta-glucanase 1-like [Potentilla anserina]
MTFKNTITLMILFIIITFSSLIPQSQARLLLSQPENPKTPSRFSFPEAQSTILPEPSEFFSQELLSTPLPTNSFFQNLVVGDGSQPEYFHPYQIKSSGSSLTLCYPNRIPTENFILQNFTADLTISTTQDDNNQRHLVSSFNDLSVTLDFPSSNLRFFLVRGSPYLTFFVYNPTAFSISTAHAITSLSSTAANQKHTLKLDNDQTWLLYSSSPIVLNKSDPSSITSDEFYGIIRVALLPGPEHELVLDQFCACYPTSGEAVFKEEPFSLDYRWEKIPKTHGDLLMLAHPLHIKLLQNNVTVLEKFKYTSIDGDLVGVVGKSWVLKIPPLPVTWHSIKGVQDKASQTEIISALSADVEALISTPISKTDSYFYGKLIARAARLALIAEEVSFDHLIPQITKFLKDAIEPWLDGTFSGDGFWYDGSWGGLVTKNGALNEGADYGFGVYNDHHFHIGYFLYSISVLTKMDPTWGIKHRDQAYALAGDFMNLNSTLDAKYTRLRNFDLYSLHSWAGGLTEFADGCNQESTSEAVNAYYSAALMGLAYNDTNLAAIGSLLAALEIQGAQTWWHVHQGDNMYEDVFTSQNKITGVVWSNKRDAGLWFASPTSKEKRLGIQVLPISPITEALFSNVSYVEELVSWTMPVEGVADEWKGFAYALEGMYNREEALAKIRNLQGFDDGNSLTNLLWWIHSRG